MRAIFRTCFLGCTVRIRIWDVWLLVQEMVVGLSARERCLAC